MRALHKMLWDTRGRGSAYGLTPARSREEGVMALSLTAAVLLLIQILGSEFSYSVQPGDSMTSIGARFGVDVRVIAEANELPVSARLKPEQLLQIDNRHIVPELHDTDIVVN